MRIIQRNNVNLTGRGQTPMLFAHGFGCDQNMWRFVKGAFESDYKVVLFDHVGAGRSDLSAYHPGKYSELQGYASDVVELCEELGLTNVTFVGHSVSTMVGVLAARQAPSLFSQLVLVGPSPRYLNDGDYVGGFEREDIEELLDALDDNYLGWASAIGPVIMGNPEQQPELTEELVNSFCRTDPAIARQFARVTFLSDNRSDLPHVRVPTLILQSAIDAIAPRYVGEYTHRHLPNSQLVVLDSRGHCPHMTAPEQTITSMRAFLGAQWSGVAHHA